LGIIEEQHLLHLLQNYSTIGQLFDFGIFLQFLAIYLHFLNGLLQFIFSCHYKVI